MPPPRQSERERGASFAQNLSMSVLSRAWQILLKGVQEVKDSPRPLPAADMVLVRLAYAADLPSPEDALEAPDLSAGRVLRASPAPSRRRGRALGRPAAPCAPRRVWPRRKLRLRQLRSCLRRPEAKGESAPLVALR